MFRSNGGLGLSSGSPVPAEQVQKFAPGLGPVGAIVRLRVLAVGMTLARDGIGAGVLFHFVGADRVGPGRVQPKDLGAQCRGDFGVAMLSPQFGRDLESSKRLDRILW